MAANPILVARARLIIKLLSKSVATIITELTRAGYSNSHIVRAAQDYLDAMTTELVKMGHPHFLLEFYFQDEKDLTDADLKVTSFGIRVAVDPNDPRYEALGGKDFGIK